MNHAGDNDLAERVKHFRLRVLQDALSEATGAYWLRRAEVLDAARPRPGDYTGRATDEQLATAAKRCGDAALGCRQRAIVEQCYGLGADIEHGADVGNAA